MRSTISILFFALLIIKGSTGSLSSSKIKPRIVGGEDASIQNFPYQASIRYQNYHFCGGAIISNRHILTAAHCITLHKHIFVAPYHDINIITGSSYSNDATGYFRRIASIIIHPGWIGTEQTSFVNDIAVIRLIGNIDFDEKQQMIELSSYDCAIGTGAMLTGWGYRSENNCEPSSQLQQLKMTIVRNTDCQLLSQVQIYRTQLCAYHGKGHGCSSADSGGPLVVNNQIVGVLSWLVGGVCASGSPEVYTNVFAHRGFIRSAMKV